jgi:hypothetical protein
MGLARRQFLQMVSAGLLGWQVMPPQMARAADLYAKNLSQSTKRKLALLIGINQYDAKGEWLPLNGCVTDVELQRELLIHRFGFKSADILTLTDRAATRTAIAEAFTEHLVAQALPGDVVVVHFSGHGSKLGQNNTLVPVDSGIPETGMLVKDLMEDTIALWLQAIATDNTTCILDTGHSYPGTPVVGNFRIRARPSYRDWQIDPEEIELQRHLREQIGSKQVLVKGDKSSAQALKVSMPGMLLRAASGDRLCADAQWPGFSSGAFTYALTQQLWQMTPATSLYVVLDGVISTLEQKAFAAPSLTPEQQLISHVAGSKIERNINQKTKTQATYTTNFDDLLIASPIAAKELIDGADGIIRTASNSRIGEAWLTGLPIVPLGYYGVGSILSTPDETLVQMRSHSGLTAKVEALPGQSGLHVDQLLQERVRALPRNMTLIVALDLNLSKIERVDATSAISAMPGMLGVNATEQFADCLFGAQATSYGLFTVGRSPILGSFGSVGESVGAALRRLQPLLESLLATKLIYLTANQGSSTLGLRATLMTMSPTSNSPVTLASKATQRFGSQSGTLAASSREILPSPNILNKAIAIGDRICCRLENFTDSPLYVRIFSFDPRGKIMTPHFFTSPYALDSVVPAQQELLIPRTEAPFDWVVSAPQGLFDIQLVVSRFPLSETTKLLEQSSRQATSPAGMVAVPNPLQVAQALLSDLHSEPDVPAATKPDDMWMLDVNDWATISFTYRVA